jgi:protein tyrosine/serine phosphatase
MFAGQEFYLLPLLILRRISLDIVHKPHQNPAMIQSGMVIRTWHRSVASKLLGRALLAMAIIAILPASAAQRGLPAQAGILNFGKINDNLYRGAQPDAPGIQSLKRLGVKTIINLRKTNDVSKAEEAAARTNGITFISVPMNGLGRPTAETVRQVLQIIDSTPSPVFIHCEHGCDRTGTIIACYRIMHDQWPSEAALVEAERYGMSSLERGMKRFVRDFAKALKQ